MATLLPLAEKVARSLLHRRGFASRFVATRAGRLHAYDAAGRGNLPATIVLHGLGSSGAAFARMMLRMQPYVRRIVALELPGHGFSDAPSEELTPELLFEVATHALDELTKEPILLVGNSMGGTVALRYAIDRPHNVRALGLLSPAGARGTESDLDDVKGAFGAKTPKEALALLRRIYAKQRWFLPLVALEFPELLARKSIRDIVASAETDHALTPEELQTLAMPVLLIWGRSERLLPARYLEYFRAHLPEHARIVEPESVGHCPHFDDPHGTADRLLDLAREA